MIQKIYNNLSKNMIWYTLLMIIMGIILGHFWDLKFLSNYMILVIFIMIYPMMVNLSLSALKRAKETIKPLSEALIINFIYAPLFLWFLCSLFIPDPKIKLAIMLLSIAPASSMGIGYIGLAAGDVLAGTIIVASAFILSIFVYPIAGQYFASGANIPVPLILILKSLLIILVLPLVLGIITREYIQRKHGAEKFLKIKPYFATITLFFLYILIFSIFASKSDLILKDYVDILLLLPIVILYYGITILLVLFINKKILKFEYRENQAVVFTSVVKNIALTIAILVAVFGKEGQYLAVFPAMMALFQSPLLMTYLKFSDKIKMWFEK